jgi:hypothetical protein
VHIFDSQRWTSFKIGKFTPEYIMLHSKQTILTIISESKKPAVYSGKT